MSTLSTTKAISTNDQQQQTSSPMSSSMLRSTSTTSTMKRLRQCADACGDDDEEPSLISPTHNGPATKKMRVANAPLPSDCANMDPDSYLVLLIQSLTGTTLRVRPAADLTFEPISEEQRAAYTTELLGLARNNQMEELKTYCESHPFAAAASNRFGESVLHMACRRGFQDMVEYLLSTPAVRVRSVDDGGRTPLHDACWHPTPQTEIASRLVTADPALLLVSDKRGFTPFQYARAQYWAEWREFLYEHRDTLQNLAGMKEFTTTTSSQ